MLLLPACQQEIKSPAPAISSPESGEHLRRPSGLHAAGYWVAFYAGLHRHLERFSAIIAVPDHIGDRRADSRRPTLRTPVRSNVAVITEPPGGGTTKTVIFTINGVQSNIPIHHSINPATATTGAGGFTLTITGTEFRLAVQGLGKWRYSAQFLREQHANARFPFSPRIFPTRARFKFRRESSARAAAALNFALPPCRESGAGSFDDWLPRPS